MRKKSSYNEDLVLASDDDGGLDDMGVEMEEGGEEKEEDEDGDDFDYEEEDEEEELE